MLIYKEYQQFRHSIGEFLVSISEFGHSIGEFSCLISEFGHSIGEFGDSIGEYHLSISDSKTRIKNPRQNSTGDPIISYSNVILSTVSRSKRLMTSTINFTAFS